MKFGKIKIDINDKLFSQFKRIQHKRCQKCGRSSHLSACHIYSRTYYSTRFDPENAVVLCPGCHDWFDSHKMTRCLWDEDKRVFAPEDESFHFLVSLGHTWDGLIALYLKSRRPFKGYSFKKKMISKYLRTLIEEIS